MQTMIYLFSTESLTDYNVKYLRKELFCRVNFFLQFNDLMCANNITNLYVI